MNAYDLTQLITERVKKKVEEYDLYKVKIGVSNRHVHVTREDLDILYGTGYALTQKSRLGQPGQFAAKETVTLRGPRGEFKNVRILGPIRPVSQVEISKTDSFRLGLYPPVRESGHLEGTPGIELIGPKGTVRLTQGVIVALRHIHMTPADAAARGLKDKDVVNVKTFGQRRGVLGDVVIRVSDKFALEMHVDVDEANACSLSNKDYIMICPPTC